MAGIPRTFKHRVTSILAAILASGPARAQVEAHPSYTRLVSANGRAVVVLSGGEDAILDRFSDHLYQQGAADVDPTWDLLYDTFFGVRDAAGSAWLKAASGYSYVAGTPIMQVQRERAGLTLTEYAWAPSGLDLPAFVHLLRVENSSSAPLEGLQIFSLHNYHLGSGDEHTGAEQVVWQDGVLSEAGTATGLGVQIVPLVAPSAGGCESVWDAVLAGDDLGGDCLSEGDDRVGALQWKMDPLDPGDVAWVGGVEAFASVDDAAGVRAQVQAWADAPEDLLADEQADWRAWLDEGAVPDELSDDERSVFEQALVFLKMGQVTEIGAPKGQIMASLPASAAVGEFQHEWNITWVRDSAYAIRALTATGHTTEAAAALRFFLQDKAGAYADSLAGVEDYAVSVCRTYGDGTEWSDDDGTGPNIELDDFGLFLWAFGQYIDATGDAEMLSDHGARVLDGVADPLVQLIDPDHDLIVADSSIWERHSDSKHFTYTSAWAVRGLREAADLADRMGDPRAAGYREAADRVGAGIENRLVRDDGVLVGNLEEYQAGGSDLDLAAVDAFNNGALDPVDAGASFDAWAERLAVPSGHGYRRNDDGDLYDEQEWVMVDLRLAEALRRACRPTQARALEDWVTAQAVQNHLIIPELMDPDTADYAGPAPMMGFGSGLYVWNLSQRAALEAACGADTGSPDSGSPDSGSPDSGASDSGAPQGDDSGVMSGARGCGCATRPARPPWLLLPLILIGLSRRRNS